MKVYTFIFFLMTIANLKAQNPWIDDLEYGEYSVGFETIRTYDFSRSYKIKVDDDFGPRPMLILVWYPAELEGTMTAMKLGYLLALENVEETLNEIIPGSEPVLSEKYTKFYEDMESIDRVINVPLKSKINATAVKGNFPLILYGSSQSSSGTDNVILCEQLASHGYIVASVASKGAYSRQMPFNNEGAEAQTRDLEFLFGHLHSYPNVDSKNLGIVGFSFGGLNMVTFSLKHKNVKAMVSLDGSIPPGYSILKSYSYLDIKEFNSNFLGFFGGQVTNQ